MISTVGVALGRGLLLAECLPRCHYGLISEAEAFLQTKSLWYSSPGHMGWARQPPGAWVSSFAVLTWTFWCLWSARSDFLFLKRRGLETLIKTPLKGIKRLPERQITLTKEPVNDLEGTMRNTPPALPLGSGVLPSQGRWWAICRRAERSRRTKNSPHSDPGVKGMLGDIAQTW